MLRRAPFLFCGNASLLLEFVEDFAEHAEEDGGVGLIQVEAAEHAAELFFGGGGAARGDVAAGAKIFEKDFGDAVDVGHGGGGFGVVALRFGDARGGTFSGEFVEADGYGLTEIHGAMLFSGGNAQEPVAVAEILVGEAPFFGAE